jgi:hypothetical protein
VAILSFKAVINLLINYNHISESNFLYLIPIGKTNNNRNRQNC